MPTIYINNKPYEVKAGQNMLQACLSLQFDIPYFCWHPAMHSVGACRMCAVKLFKDEQDTTGKIVMACMIPAKDGMRISINDPEVLKFRKGISELLMLNHPHDCPICDEGGECHLQDMTLMTSQVYRRNRFRKRTHCNQYLGPFIRHEMNRCIQCYRCVRFYVDCAGGRDFNVFGWHDSVYFGRHEDGVLQNEFSGNLIEVCPTGVFTDKTFAKHYTRKWDLQTAPSVCVHCGLGCNIIPGERYGTLRRIHNRFNQEVNGYFLCDRGRFGYEFVNSGRRMRQVLTRNAENKFEPQSKEKVIAKISDILKYSHRILGIGSPRASLESNFALRNLVKPENFFAGTSAIEHELITKACDIIRNVPVRTASMQDVALADAVLILGEDINNTAPMLSLSIRKSILRKPAAIPKKLQIEEWNDTAFREAIGQEKGPLFIAATNSTALDDAATKTYRASPDDLARLGFAIAHEIDSNSPAVSGLNNDVLLLAQRIAKELRDAERPVIISGISASSKAIIEAAANIVNALHLVNKKPQICFTMPNCNSMGLGLMGSNSIESAVELIQNRHIDTIIILENDIYRYLDVEIANKLLTTVKNVIAIDSLENATTSKAHFVLPAATFAESSGTMVNNEGRAQRFFKVFPPQGDIQDSWRWIEDISTVIENKEIERKQNLDDVIKNIADQMDIFKPIKDIAPLTDFRIAGQKIPRQPHRYSGRTAIHTDVDVNEPKLPQDNDSAMNFSMEGFQGLPPASLTNRFWAPNWNSVQSVNKYQREIGGQLHGGDAGKRLIEPKESTAFKYYAEIPDSFFSRKDELLIVPAYHIFGSEELSSISPGIAELSAKPYIAINPDDKAKLVIDAMGMTNVIFSNTSYTMLVKFSSSLPVGIAAVPIGLSNLPWDGRPVWCKFTRS